VLNRFGCFVKIKIIHNFMIFTLMILMQQL
jgi:hypothetical protein